MKTAVVIGGGPAGLAAAEALSAAGITVTVCEAKPSIGRKFLMAGKSGLNLTKAEDPEVFMQAFAEARGVLGPIVSSFDAAAIQGWAESLGQQMFVGSTGRVFPTAMKASPLLRAWLARLDRQGVEFRTRWNWQGWKQDTPVFDTPNGEQLLQCDVTILALGGASWPRLGATGAWAPLLQDRGAEVAPFAPSNVGVKVEWSQKMQKHFGSALKNVRWTAGSHASRGEAILSEWGLEGGGIYTVSRGVREGAMLHLDLLPDQALPHVIERLSAPRGKASLANHLRKRLGLTPAKIALLQEMARPLPSDSEALSLLLKALPVRHAGLRPMDEAISTAGGLTFANLDRGLMLKQMPGVFAAGEMLDWEAPTGGYLLTACLATGRWAGQHAAKWVLG